MPVKSLATRLAAVLLTVDVALMVVHQLRLPLGLSWHWSLDVDGSIPELYGYAKGLAVALLLLALYRRRGSTLVLGWAAALAAITIDDAFQVHERGGWHLAHRLGIPQYFGLRPVDVGELLVWGLLGATIAMSLWCVHRRADHWARHLSVRLAALVVLLAGFAVGMDMVHSLLPPPLGRAGILLEDGGEHVVQSALLVYGTYGLVTSIGRISGPSTRTAHLAVHP